MLQIFLLTTKTDITVILYSVVVLQIRQGNQPHKIPVTLVETCNQICLLVVTCAGYALGTLPA